MVRDNPLKPLEATIQTVRRENADTFTLALHYGRARPGYTFVPGQFNMVGLFGFEEAPISLASAPGEDGSFQHTIKVVGRVTKTLSNLKEGDAVGLRGPYGAPWPVEELRGKNLLAVAGGIGLAPLRSVLQHVFQHRDGYGKVTLLYGAKSPGEVIYADELTGWTSQPDATVGLTVDRVDGQPFPRSPEERGKGQPWQHHVGVVPTLFEKVPVAAANTLALVCGPEVMMKFVLVDLFKRGFSPERIFVSMERRMRCGVAQCGHCMFGPKFICRDGPVFRFSDIQHLFGRGL